MDKKIQLPKDQEARRCVLIVIEEHIGVPLQIITEKGFEYVTVSPYKQKAEEEATYGGINMILGMKVKVSSLIPRNELWINKEDYESRKP